MSPVRIGEPPPWSQDYYKEKVAREERLVKNMSIPKSVTEDYSRRIVEQLDIETKWIEMLKSKGIAAAHPADNWYSKELNKIILSKPYFINNKKVVPGCIIAIGDASKYRLAKVQQIDQWTNCKQCWLEPDHRGLLEQTMGEIKDYWHSLFNPVI